MSAKHPPIPVKEFTEFISIVRRLRRDCPWDRKQTHRSLRAGLMEEAYEVMEALDDNDLDSLRGELGDVLLHIALQTTIAEEESEFTLAEVLEAINTKLIRRHPHVFGTRKVRSAGEVKKNWDQIKMDEGRTSVLDGVPASMPALQRALKVQERAARVGFDWKKKSDVWNKIREETEELRRAIDRKRKSEREDEFGDLLFALVNYARFLDINPEQALRGTIDKFFRRFQYIERTMKRQGRDIHRSSLEEMDLLWNEAKKKPLPRARRRKKTGAHSR